MNRQESFSKRIWRLFSPALLYVLVTFMVELVFMTVVMMRNIDLTQYPSYEEMMVAYQKLVLQYQYEMSMIAAAAVIPLLINMLRRDREMEMAEGTLKAYEKPDPLSYIGVAVMGLSSCILANSLLHISGIYTLLEGEAVTQSTASVWGGKLFFEIIGLGVLASFSEELAFRALTLRRMELIYGTKMAVIWSSLVFALIHGSTIQGIYALCVGLMAGFLYVRYRNLIAPTIFHMSANILSVLQNETRFLDRFFESTAGLVGVCIVSALAFLVYFYLTLTRVEGKELPQE